MAKPRKQRRIVYHSGLQSSGPGATSLWTFGYAALARVLEQPMPAIVEAVLDGRLDPLDLAGVAQARQEGLAVLADPPQPRGRDRVEELRLVELCDWPQAYGLNTLWGYGYRDVALAAGLSKSRVKVTRRAGAWDPRSLASTLDYIAGARA